MNKTVACQIVKIEEEQMLPLYDETLVNEYPLAIMLNGKKIATLLCSPEKLKELVLGFLRTERLILDIGDVTDFELDEEKGVARVTTLRQHASMESFHSKKVDLDKLENAVNSVFDHFLDSVNCEPLDSRMTLPVGKIFEFMRFNLNYSDVFKETGGVHCIALCDTERVVAIAEDVARHNALDKVIGESLIRGIYLKDKILILSGRVSLEMILKAAKLQIPMIVSKSAPTSLSVALAKKLNITLIGFVRGNKMNIYANEDRVVYEPAGCQK